MWEEESLRNFGYFIQRLLEKKDLSREESYSLFCEVLGNRQPELHQGAFLAALSSKGEIPEEIAGAWQAIYEWDTVKVPRSPDPPVVENSGTGMDPLKTFNVSTGAAIVASAAGVRIARHAARALTSRCGAVDVIEALGVNVEAEVTQVLDSVTNVGIGVFNGMSSKVHPNALFRILSQIRFGSTLNIAASLASPCLPSHGLRGVWAEPVMKKALDVMKEIGYERAMVVHGFDRGLGKGMDEISITGPTKVLEWRVGREPEYYTLCPEDLGLSPGRFDDIAAKDLVDEEAVRLLQILAGKGNKACTEMVCLNAGAILYLVEKATNLRNGFEKSMDVIEDGRAVEKLCRWVQTQAHGDRRGVERLRVVAERAGLKEVVDRYL